jgi:hypothetical protein
MSISDLKEKAEKIFSAFGQTLEKFPVALPEMTTGKYFIMSSNWFHNNGC